MEENKEQKNIQEKIVEENENEYEDYDNFDDVLESVPPEVRSEVKRVMSMSLNMRRVMSPETEVMRKVTSEHISKFLDSQDTAMNKQFQEVKESKIYTFGIFLFTLIFIVILIILLKDNPEVMEKVLFTLGGLVTGAIGGYGYGKTKNN